MINKPLPLIGIIIGLLILRSLKGGALFIMGQHYIPGDPCFVESPSQPLHVRLLNDESYITPYAPGRPSPAQLLCVLRMSTIMVPYKIPSRPKPQNLNSKCKHTLQESQMESDVIVFNATVSACGKCGLALLLGL